MGRKGCGKRVARPEPADELGRGLWAHRVRQAGGEQGQWAEERGTDMQGRWEKERQGAWPGIREEGWV